MIWPFVILIITMAAVVAVLFWGLLTMARGGSEKGSAYNLKWSNTIMRWRILLQALAVAVFIGILMAGLAG